MGHPSDRPRQESGDGRLEVAAVETVKDLGPYAASVRRDACSDVAGAVCTALGAVFIGRVGRKLARWIV